MTVTQTQNDPFALPLNRSTVRQVAAALPPDCIQTLLAPVRAAGQAFTDALRTALRPGVARYDRLESMLHAAHQSWDDVGDDAQISARELEMDLARILRDQRELGLARLNETKARAGYAPGCDPDDPLTPLAFVKGYMAKNPPPPDLFRKRGPRDRLDPEGECWLNDFAAQPYVRRKGARAAHRALNAAGVRIGLSAINRRMHN